jgi:small-conductance mechanosensitive channel
VIIELRFWIDRPTPPRRWQATNGAVEAVTAAFREEGIESPFAQRELTGRAEMGGFRAVGAEPEAPSGASDRPRPAADGDPED